MAAIAAVTDEGAVAALVRELRPSTLVIVAPGNESRPSRVVLGSGPPADVASEAVALAAACARRDCLPARTVVVHFPSAGQGTGRDRLDAVFDEIALSSLVELCLRLHPVLRRAARSAAGAPAPALDAVLRLVDAIESTEPVLDWPAIFSSGDDARAAIAASYGGPELDGLDHLEWSMVWALIEELDRRRRTS